MKKTSKLILTVLCVVLALSASVMGTVAYLIDHEEVVNTFTVGDVDIKLDEAKVNKDGTVVEGADRVTENEYHLIPGRSYVKDPTMTVVKGSEESYVRILVTISNAKELKAIFGEDFLPQNYVEGWDGAIWPCAGITEDQEANTLTYEFRYFETVDAYEAQEDVVLPALFTKFLLPGDQVNNEQLKTLEGLTITAIGHAIQRVALDTADEAWAAFDAQYAAENPVPTETTAP